MSRESEIEAIVDDLLTRVSRGEKVDVESLATEYPHLEPELGERLQLTLAIAQAVRSPSSSGRPPHPGRVSHLRCPHCGHHIDVVEEVRELTCRSCGSTFEVDPEATLFYPASKAPTLGRFRVESEVGRGTFGVVYEAFDTQLGRRVAVKLPRTGTFESASEERQFLREAQFAATLQHPGIVRVYEVGRADGTVYIVSELIAGVTLNDLLSGTRLTFRETAQLVATVCEALQHAHDQGIIHRDIKPSNILIDSDNRPYLADFGLARRAEAATTITRDGDIVGTPAYMSPEQAAGEHTKVDHRSDVYSLGTMLYRMLSGELPFRGSQRMLLNQVMNDDPKPIRQINEHVPRDLETITLKAMAKEPSARYQTAREVGAELTRWLNRDPIQARPPSAPERAWRWCRKRPVISGLLALVSCLLLTISIGSAAWGLRESQLKRENLNRARQAVRQLSRSHIRQGLWTERTGRSAEALFYFVESLAAEESLNDHTGSRLARIRCGQILRRLPSLVSCSASGMPIRRVDLVQGQLLVTGESALLAGGMDRRTPRRRVELKNPRTLSVGPDVRRAVAVEFTSHEGVLLDLESDTVLARLQHDDAVTDAVLSPDGTLVASFSMDGTVKVWNSSDGGLQQTFEHPGYLVTSGRINAANNWLVTWQQSKTDARSRLHMRALDADSEREFEIGEPTVGSVVFLDDETFFVGDSEGTIRHLSVSDSDFRGRSFVDEGRVNQMLVTPTGELLALTSAGRATLWNVESGHRISQTNNPGASQLTISPDCSLYALTGPELPVMFYWTHSGREAAVGVPHTTDVTGLVFLDDNRRVVVAESAGLIRVWDLAGSTQAAQVLVHESPVYKARFAPDSRRIATIGRTNNAALWSSSGQLIASLEHETACLYADFSSDGKTLATGASDGRLHLWDGLSGTRRPEPAGTSDQAIYRLEFSPTDPRVLAVGRADGTAELWTTEGPRVTATWKHPQRINSLRFDASGRYVQSSDNSGVVNIWDVDGNKLAINPLNHDGWIRSSAFSPDGTLLLTSGQELTLWDWKQSRKISQRRIRRPLNARFRFDGSLVCATEGRRRVGVFRPNALDVPVWSFREPDARWHEFHPALPLMATAGGEVRETRARGVANLWDLRSGAAAVTEFQHWGTVNQVHLAPDGQSLLTTSTDRTARIWDLSAVEQSVRLLREKCTLLTGRESESRRPLAPEDHAELFSKLRSEDPMSFIVADKDLLGWRIISELAAAELDPR